MKNHRTETFIYEGLGFPIKLIDIPMRKMLGEWIMDIDMTELQLVVLRALAYKPTPLTKDELRFIRKFLVMTTTEFGKALGLSHVAVVQWEGGKRRLSPPLELCIRLYVLDHLQAKDKEFRNLYGQISLEKLSKGKNQKVVPLAISAAEDLKIA